MQGAFLHGKVAALKDEGCFTLVTKRSVANLQNWFVSALNWGFSGRCRDVYLRRGECRFLKLAVLQGEPLRGVGCHKLGGMGGGKHGNAQLAVNAEEGVRQ